MLDVTLSPNTVPPSVMYSESHGYEDVRRFDSAQELLEEIKRLQKFDHGSFIHINESAQSIHIIH
jgi:hypothetical protein